MKKQIIDESALSSVIKKSITEDIIRGKIQPGEKLIEAKYAEEFGTSRAPIREAFYLLTLEGFVQKIPRKGTVVRGYSPEEIKDLLEIRCFVEDLAMERIRNKDITDYLDRMQELIHKMKAHTKGEEYTKLNFQFHFELILASGSEVIKNMYSRLGTPLLSVQSMSFMEEHNVKKSLAEHQLMIRYLREGAIDEAKALLDSHNKAVFPRIEKYVGKKPDEQKSTIDKS